jgi:diphosphomevalonate decarboxylase
MQKKTKLMIDTVDSGKIAYWKSPSNIALIKYWGKHGVQLPMNPSISMTLEKSYTETQLEWEEVKSGQRMIDFAFEGVENEKFQHRIEEFLSRVEEYLPAIHNYHLKLKSSNNFPHSSGIASSASAMSALALCLVEMEQKIHGKLHYIQGFKQKASILSRLGSGSASRSVYGGFSLWGFTNLIPHSSDEYAIPITDYCHPVFKGYHDAILIVSNKPKGISSSLGHSLMKKNPYAKVRFEQAYKNTETLIEIMRDGDQIEFAHLVEAEALALHAMMMTSNPNFILMEPFTLEIIQKVRDFRAQTDIPVAFTLDAGANVHILYPEKSREKVVAWINDELLKFCAHKKWIDDKIGLGPSNLLESK